MLIGSILKNDGKFCQQTFSKEFNYIIEKEKKKRYIDEEVRLSSGEDIYGNEQS